MASAWLSQPPVWNLVDTPTSSATPVLVILEPHQALPCLLPLLISEIPSSLASVCPTQLAFKAQLQSTSSRKPSLPAAPHTGLTLSSAAAGLGTGDALLEFVD